MRWQHQNTKRIFTRASDELVKLKHRNANEYMSQIVHIPAHAMREMRPDNPSCWNRIDILFKNVCKVELPGDMAEYLLKVFPRVVFRIDKVVFHYDKMGWIDLLKLGKELKIYIVGMKKADLIQAIKEARNDIS